MKVSVDGVKTGMSPICLGQRGVDARTVHVRTTVSCKIDICEDFILPSTMCVLYVNTVEVRDEGRVDSM